MRRQLLCPVIKVKDGIGRLMVFSCLNAVSGGFLIFHFFYKFFSSREELSVGHYVLLSGGMVERWKQG